MSLSLRSVLQRLVRGRAAIEDVWLLLPVLGVFIVLNFTVIRPNDFWWHLRTGQIIVETLRLPTQDLFSFTRAGQPWINQGWLMEVLFYLLYRAGGLALIIFFQAAVITGGYVFVEAAALNAARRARPAAWATFTALLLGADSWNLRPQGISFLLFGFLLWVLECDRRAESRLTWGLPALFALWGNLHGGFVFGLGLLAIYAVGRTVADLSTTRRLGRPTQRLLIASGLSLAALSVNPVGPAGLAQYVLGFLRSDATQRLNVEFAAISIRDLDGLFLFGVAGIFLWLAYRRRMIFPGIWLAALAVFGLYTLYSRRVAPWFGMAAAPSFAFAFAAPAADTPRFHGKSSSNYALIGLLVALALLSLPWLRPGLPLPLERRAYALPSETPERATEELCGLGSDTRVFTEMGYASYVTWACPTVLVFVDSRIELYPAPLWQEYMLVSAGQFGWEAVLRKYEANAILASKQRQGALIAAASASAEWRLVYEDADAVLFCSVTRPGCGATTGETLTPFPPLVEFVQFVTTLKGGV